MRLQMRQREENLNVGLGELTLIHETCCLMKHQPNPVAVSLFDRISC
jgi:hypothetical protein